ncbi:MAG: ubiquinol-cytochrome c reductase iron-sulfur subunit [Ardenticatenales bacterium]|nr:ubiquinol-cytochrome c reductase iron-sulfur subunit [Ardenticatenales bacterium]
MADDDSAVEGAEPAWKRDFPYEAAAEEEVTRREFARYLVLGTGALAIGNIGLAAWTQLRRVAGGEPRAIVALADLPIGATHLFRYPTEADPAVMLRVSEDQFVAFSQKCTHLGCVVYHQPERDRWHCPCHKGDFDAISGAVLSGPPTRPLDQIVLEVRPDGFVWALGREVKA